MLSSFSSVPGRSNALGCFTWSHAMTTQSFDAAMVCLDDAKRHALDGADYKLAGAINYLLDEHRVPKTCQCCGQVIPVKSMPWTEASVPVWTSGHVSEDTT